MAISAFTLSYGISQLPAGWLADRIGQRILITIGVCGVALAGLLVGFSQTYIMMIVFLALMGVLGGGYYPASPPLILASVEPKNQGRALGLHTIGGSASYFLSPLIAAAIAIIWDWRGSFITLAAPSFVFGIVFYVLLRRLADTKEAEHRIITSHNEAPPSIVYHSKHIHPGCHSFCNTFIPLFLVDQFGVGKETVAALIALIYSSGLWATPLGGYLSDRLGRVLVVLAACLIVGPIIYLLNLVPYSLGIGALLVTIGVIMYVRMPVSEAYIVGHTSVRNRSTILGIYYFSSMEGSGVLTLVMGYLIDQLRFYPSFTIASAALVVVTLICSVWLWGS